MSDPPPEIPNVTIRCPQAAAARAARGQAAAVAAHCGELGVALEALRDQGAGEEKGKGPKQALVGPQPTPRGHQAPRPVPLRAFPGPFLPAFAFTGTRSIETLVGWGRRAGGECAGCGAGAVGARENNRGRLRGGGGGAGEERRPGHNNTPLLHPPAVGRWSRRAHVRDGVHYGHIAPVLGQLVASLRRMFG